MHLEIIGYIAAIAIGLILGLIGGGGSILTVPVLKYLFEINTEQSTYYSLFIVGLTSAVGSVLYFKSGLVHLRAAVAFGIPSIIMVYISRNWILPSIPSEVFRIANFSVTKGMLMMLLFAILMIAASYSMIKKKKSKAEDIQPSEFNYPFIWITGAAVGLLTGLVGVGGGFLIIPALVVFCRLPMKEAVATSLVIITTNSGVGFLGQGGEMHIDWSFLVGLSALAILGMFIGMKLSKMIDGAKLKPAFGWFVLAMGIYILIKELGSLSHING